MKLTASQANRIGRGEPTRAPEPVPEPIKQEAPAENGQEAINQARADAARADARLAQLLTVAADRLNEERGEARGYRMAHTFKRDSHGRIVSAETIVTPLGS